MNIEKYIVFHNAQTFETTCKDAVWKYLGDNLLITTGKRQAGPILYIFAM
jgi:hypothetical protein